MSIITIFGTFMAMQFEKRDDGYLYRANGKGPAYPASEAEFERHVRLGGISFLLHVAAFMLAVIAAALLTARWFPGGSEAGGFVLMGGLLLVISLVLARSMRWAMLAPAREFSGRTPVA